MTSGHPPTPQPPGDQAGHPDLESLADLDAGLTDPATTARLTKHVGRCPTCAGVLGALDAVRADLRALPPPRLPDSVAARLDATLAQLRAGDAPPERTVAGEPPRVGSDGGSGRPASAPGRPADTDADDLARVRDRRRGRTRRLTTLVAASAVVLAALVGVGTAVLHHGKGDSTNLATGAAVPAEGGSSTGGGRPGTPAQRRPDGATDQAQPGPAAVGPQSYTRVSLAAALPEIARTSAVGEIYAAGVSGPGGAMADRARLTRCATSIPAVPGQLTAARQVVFEGALAYVLVYDDAERGLDAVVVAADCGLTGGAPTVLYRLTG